jgi:AAA15 family ATPase/GTPase
MNKGDNMLIEFSVANYRSFKEKITFSMVATHVTAKNKEIDANNVFEAGMGLRLLKTAAIYGANASGKSNFAKALRFMREFVLNSSRESQAADVIPTEPFQLSIQTEKQPSFFEIVFILKGTRFRYGFEVTAQRIVSEWLFRTPTRREAKLFERHFNEIELGTSFKEGRELEPRTRENALFLSVVAQFNGEVARSILKWFRSLDVRLGIDDIADRISTLFLLDEKEHHNEIVQFIKQLDLGIQDIHVERRAFSLPSMPKASEISSAIPVDVFNEFAEVFTKLAQSIGTSERPEAQTVHRVFDDQGQPINTRIFDFDRHESEGTKKLFGLAGSLVPALTHGRVIVVDELDARLHPLITCTIIELFNSPVTNPHNAQLVFTTHDTNLLSNTVFRRDQIWFVEKDRFGASHLYSLVEFKVRNDASFEKDYIQGRYGAIPFIGDLNQVLGHSDG